jgi:hypothetical protein
MSIVRCYSRRMDGLSQIGSAILRKDMYFHQPTYRDYRWLETNAFSWTIPEAHMRSNIWLAFRTNLGVVEAAVFIYSNPDPTGGLLGNDYLDHRHHMPIPTQNLDHYQLANGVEVRMTKPMEEWELRYDGSHDTVLDLRFQALMPPVHIAETGTDDAEQATIRYGHLDQMMSVTGHVRVRGRGFDVDWPAWRDHSWSPRPESSSSGYGSAISSNFDYGSFGNEFSFFVQTRNQWDCIERGVITNGYVLDNGTVLRIKHGEGRYSFAPNGWVTTGVEYELEDERGRTHIFRGEPKSFGRFPITSHLACIRWTDQSGEVGWGEYLWHGDLYRMQEQLAARPGARQ